MRIRRFYSLLYNTLELLEEKTVRLSSVRRFNDPLESLTLENILDSIGKNALEKSIDKEKFMRFLKSARIGCFTGYDENDSGTKKPDKNERSMWAHYADSHRGICVEYEYNKRQLVEKNRFFSENFELNGEQIIADDMSYNGDVTPIKIVDWGSVEEILRTSFFYKDNAFEGEKEFRIVSFNIDEEREDFITLEGCKVQKVIFGLRCPVAMKKIIKKIINNKEIKYAHISKDLTEEVESWKQN